MVRARAVIVINLALLVLSSCSLFEEFDHIRLRDASSSSDATSSDATASDATTMHSDMAGADVDLGMMDGGDAAVGDVALDSTADAPDASRDMADTDMANTDMSDGGGPDMADPFAGRVTSGLSLLFTFSDPTEPLRDESGVSPPLPMTYNNYDRLAGRNGIHLASTETLLSGEPPTKFYDAVRTSEEFTLECWVLPDSFMQGGPARIVTFSKDSTNANLMLAQGRVGQDTDDVTYRVRNVDPNASMAEQLYGGPGWHVDTFEPDAAQYVVTFSNGVLTSYENGVQLGQLNRPIDFNQWDDSFHLAIGNEINDPRPWAGEVYLVAAYSRALELQEIFKNYQAGAYAPRP